ncbi:murein biosynthesis integral membrane protein MurJ [Jiangella rhizosphaerae]|uniref:Murein biosynthesis integral membrane protein MurJ n=1 Tax=Jiangella rhizosphaerae TaxID=2293569 RepID=A0A418KVQ8_9ACTN|nr:murein biosynthesis integral membrane protein MurJ [Jiangella rhizosphaerae]RIQ33634.1 murein biosynthesis integral membrane protein MurJ [Jiangella rhizosphaerae]
MTATQEPPRSSGLLGSSAIMAAGTVVSRLTGFARAAVIAAAIGLTAATADVFNVPNVLPNMIYILVGGGVLNSVLVPVLVRAIKNDADGGQAFSQRLFSLAVTVLALATAIAVLAAPWLMQLIVDDRFLQPDMRPYFDNMVMFARFCLPQIFFYGLYVLIGQMLNAKGRFGPMMWSPILNNVVSIAVFGVFLFVYGTQGFEPFTTTQTLLLGLGSTLGVVAQAVILIPVLRKTGFSLRFRTDWRGQGLGESVRLGLWTVAFVVVNQLAYLVVVKVASGASSVSAGDAGAGYSVYANAMLIMMVPHSIITVSLATALLPRLSDLASDGHLDEVREKLVSALRMCLAVIIPLGALMAALAFPLTAMIFDYGSAGGQTGRLAMTLIVLMPGLVAFTVHYLVLRGFYALQDTKTPFYTQIWVSAVIMVGAVGVAIFSPGDQYVTMALAGGYSVAYLVGASVGAVRLQQRIGSLGGGRLVQHVVRLLIHSAVAAGLAWLVWRGWTGLGVGDALPSLLARALELVIGGTVGVATFVGLAYAFRVAEVRSAVTMVLARLRGGGRTAPAVDPGDLLEDTAEYHIPVETGTLSIFRRPVDPDMTSEFFLDETLPGVPSFFDTHAGGYRDRAGVGGAVGLDAARETARVVQPLPGTRPGAPQEPPSGSRGLVPGQRRTVAGRYRFERLLEDADGIQSWQAVDDVLRRAVFVQAVALDDPRAPGFATAARVSSTVSDPRFLRILDVGSDDVAYVVREWTPGQSLAALLAHAGAFHPEQAAAVGREVAEAMATAHAQGLAHRHLDPTLVFVTADGSVKIAGLETEYALRGPAQTPCAPTDPSNPSAAELDAIGIGGVLYAALTARWPVGTPGGLPPAPLIDGRLASPRQVRPGVPRLLDAVTDRAIGHARRHHATPLVTPLEIATELANGSRHHHRAVVADEAVVAAPPALLDEPGPPPPSRVEQLRERRKSGRTARLLGVMAAMLLLVGATLVGLQLLLGAIDDAGDDESPSASAPGVTGTTPAEETPAAEPTAIAVAAATDYDPAGNDEENSSDVGNVVDGDPETTWTTVNYYDPLEDQKAGVGVYLDLGQAVPVREVRLALINAGATVELRVAPEDATQAPADLDGWTAVDTVEDAEQNVTRTLDEAVTTRYLLVWFTQLPLADDGNYRSGIAEAEVLG